MGIATNLTSICCVYKEKIVKKLLILKNVASIQIQNVTIFKSDYKKISNKFDKKVSKNTRIKRRLENRL